MKETIQANIGTVAFTLDRDAYEALKNYLDDVRSRLPENDAETSDDIERRFAEIFRECLSSPMQVITLEMARAAMERMGSPADFGEQRTPAGSRPAPRVLRRSVDDRIVAGVCGGLAAFFGADATLIRIVTLLLLFCGGLSVWVYLILWIIIPASTVSRLSAPLKNR